MWPFKKPDKDISKIKVTQGNIRIAILVLMDLESSRCLHPKLRSEIGKMVDDLDRQYESLNEKISVIKVARNK